MSPPGVVMVTDKNGVRGTIDTIAWPLDGSTAEVLVQLETGQQVLVPLEALIRQGEGHYALTMDLAALAQHHGGGLRTSRCVCCRSLWKSWTSRNAPVRPDASASPSACTSGRC